jgi:hypothetical protein
VRRHYIRRITSFARFTHCRIFQGTGEPDIDIGTILNEFLCNCDMSSGITRSKQSSVVLLNMFLIAILDAAREQLAFTPH